MSSHRPASSVGTELGQFLRARRAQITLDDWDNQLRACVTHLRALSGLEPDAPDLAQIVGELVLKSPEFARLWDRYDVRSHTRGHKTFHHPEVGDLSLGYQSMRIN